MTQLALAVDATDELWTLDALPTPEAPYVEVGDELIEVRSRFPSSYYTLTGETLPPRIRVRRGIAGTTKASHIQGATLTPNYGLGSGGGGGAIAVTDGVVTVNDVTTLQTPSITDLGGGTVVLGPITGSPAAVFYSETDPGAVGAGALWLRWDPGYLLQSLYVRNDDDTDWVPAVAAQYGADGTNPTPTVTHYVSGSGEDIITYTDAEDEVSILSLPTDPAGQLLLRIKDEATGAVGAFLGSATEVDCQWQDGLGAAATVSLLASGVCHSNTDDGVTGRGTVLDNEGLHIGPLGTPGIVPSGSPALCSGDDDPAAGAGVAAPIGSLYLRTNGTHYRKTSAPDTGWVTP